MGQGKKIAFEESGVRVVMARPAAPIEVCTNRRMSVEEARALIACINRAIGCYCDEVEKAGYLPHWIAAGRAGNAR